ncbi:hypothetical protein ABK040_008263 [Willaertia magna]
MEQQSSNSKYQEALEKLKQRVAQKKQSSSFKVELNETVTVPDEFICPITRSIMLEPVLTQQGYTYEREAVEHWFKTNDTEPATGNKVTTKQLYTNRSLQNMIKDFLEINKGKIDISPSRTQLDAILNDAIFNPNIEQFKRKLELFGSSLFTPVFGKGRDLVMMIFRSGRDENIVNVCFDYMKKQFTKEKIIDLLCHRDDTGFNSLLHSCHSNSFTVGFEYLFNYLYETDKSILCQNELTEISDEEDLLSNTYISNHFHLLDNIEDLEKKKELALLLWRLSDILLDRRKLHERYLLLSKCCSFTSELIKYLHTTVNLDNYLKSKSFETDKHSLIHIAASSSKDDALNYLYSLEEIEHNPKTKNGYFPIHTALMQGQVNIALQILQRYNVDLLEKSLKPEKYPYYDSKSYFNYHGGNITTFSTLEFALLQSNNFEETELYEEMLKKASELMKEQDLERVVCCSVIGSKRNFLMKLLTDQKFVNIVTTMETNPQKVSTLLHLAVLNGNVEMFELLLDFYENCVLECLTSTQNRDVEKLYPYNLIQFVDSYGRDLVDTICYSYENSTKVNTDLFIKFIKLVIKHGGQISLDSVKEQLKDSKWNSISSKLKSIVEEENNKLQIKLHQQNLTIKALSKQVKELHHLIDNISKRKHYEDNSHSNFEQKKKVKKDNVSPIDDDDDTIIEL